MPGLKARLAAWAARSFERGLMVQSGDWAAALAYIEALEARVAVYEAGHVKGGKASAGNKTPEQRRAWAIDASKRRWCGRARMEPERLFEG